MGASCWVYYTPYQEDIEKAFQAVRQQVFESQQFHHWADILEYETAKEALCVEHGVDPWDPEAAEQLLQEVGPIQITQARTIEEYFQKPDDGQGTHSILDLSRFSSHDEGIAIPQHLIERLVSDQRPSREVIEAIVLQDVLWSQIRFWIESALACRASEPYQLTVFEFSEEVLQFLAKERSPQEVVEVLLAHEHLWRALYQCICCVVRHLLDTSQQGTMLSFPPERMMEFFGTEKLTREAVEEAVARGSAWGILSNWTGCYAILYLGDLPCEIVFIGCSGD